MVEATGGYQRAVVLRMFDVSLPVAVVNPSRVRQYARALWTAGQDRQTRCLQFGGVWETSKAETVRGKSGGGRYLTALLVRRRQVEEIEIQHLERELDQLGG